jgi:hypothetical protein
VLPSPPVLVGLLTNISYVVLLPTEGKELVKDIVAVPTLFAIVAPRFVDPLFTRTE